MKLDLISLDSEKSRGAAVLARDPVISEAALNRLRLMVGSTQVTSSAGTVLLLLQIEQSPPLSGNAPKDGCDGTTEEETIGGKGDAWFWITAGVRDALTALQVQKHPLL